MLEHDRPRWRFRVSTLMLLVIIAGLASALVVEHWKRMVAEERAGANARLAEAEARLALAQSLRVQAQAQEALAQTRKAVPETNEPLSTPPPGTSGRAAQVPAERKERGP